MKRAESIFLTLIILAVMLPLAGLFGAKSAVRIAGVESDVELPVFSCKSVFSGDWQKKFGKYYQRKMFFRGEMLVVKNSIFDILNLGQFHSGYSGKIIQGDNGYLFESPYLDVKYNPPVPYHDQWHRDEFSKVAKLLKTRLARRGVAFGMILAPSKADVCEEFVPTRYRIFSNNTECFDIYESREESLKKAGVSYVNGNKVCEKFTDKSMMFPYGGTHWTLFCAGLCASNLFERMNVANISDIPSITITSTGVVSDCPFTTDVDLSFLKNLPWRFGREWNMFHGTDILATEKSTKNICLFGDSFNVQLYEVLKRSQALNDVSMMFNRLPDKKYIEKKLDNCSALILTYSAYSLSKRKVVSDMKYLLKLLD